MWTSGRKCNFLNKGCESSSLQPVNINGWFWADGNKRWLIENSWFTILNQFLHRIPATNTPSRQTFWSGTGQGGQRQPDNFEGLKAGALDNVKVSLEDFRSQPCLFLSTFLKYKLILSPSTRMTRVWQWRVCRSGMTRPASLSTTTSTRTGCSGTMSRASRGKTLIINTNLNPYILGFVL